MLGEPEALVAPAVPRAARDRASCGAPRARVEPSTIGARSSTESGGRAICPRVPAGTTLDCGGAEAQSSAPTPPSMPTMVGRARTGLASRRRRFRVLARRFVRRRRRAGRTRRGRTAGGCCRSTSSPSSSPTSRSRTPRARCCTCASSRGAPSRRGSSSRSVAEIGGSGTRSGARRSTIASSDARGDRGRAAARRSPTASTSDREATVADLYPRLVDQIARDRLVAAGVKLGDASRIGRRTAIDSFLARAVVARSGAAARTRATPALERRLTRWVDDGLARGEGDDRGGSACISTSARAARSRSSCGCTPTTTRRSACRCRSSGRRATTRSRSCATGDPVGDLEREFAELRPLLADGGDRVRRGAAVRECELDAETVVVLPARPDAAARGARRAGRAADGVAARADAAARERDRAQRAARATQRPAVDVGARRRSTGGSRSATSELTRRSCARSRRRRARSSRSTAAGRRCARRREARAALPRADGSRASASSQLVRARLGPRDRRGGARAGGRCRSTARSRAAPASDARFRRCGRRRGCGTTCSRSRSRGTGGCGCSAISVSAAMLADDMGLGKTVQAIAMFVSERAQFGREALGPTLVVCPMSVARQWVRELIASRPVCACICITARRGSRTRRCTRKAHATSTSSSRRTTSRRATSRRCSSSTGTGCSRRGAGREEPADRRARSLRLLRARRRVAMTGTPIENRLGELWAIMDLLNPGLLGSREWFNRAFARADRARRTTSTALERLRGIVRPFILRRAKDEPEVELDLPPITVGKDYCRLTIEQASLYQATVDTWLPRIEAARGSVRPPRRGARDARAAEAGVQPPGDADAGRRRRSTDARASSSGWSSCCSAMPAGDKALVFTQYPSFDRFVAVSRASGSVREVEFFHGAAERDGSASELLTEFASEERAARKCSSSRSARAAAG